MGQDTRDDGTGRPCRGDAGQGGVGLALAATALAVIAVLVLGTLARTVNDRARARTAADAAALAGVTGGPEAAARVAAANGGALERFEVIGPAVEASVRVGTAGARSRAAPRY
jgi:hypothetical protein